LILALRWFLELAWWLTDGVCAFASVWEGLGWALSFRGERHDSVRIELSWGEIELQEFRRSCVDSCECFDLKIKFFQFEYLGIADMAVFNAPSTSLSRPTLQFGFQVQSLPRETNPRIQDFRAQRQLSSVVVCQPGNDFKWSQIRVRGLGKTSRALAEPPVAGSLAAAEPDTLRESGANDNGSFDLKETELEEEDVNEGKLSEEGGENGAISPAALQREVSRRRNFAIISHPDAGKTTLVNSQLRIPMR